jgi:hypothetical protein
MFPLKDRIDIEIKELWTWIAPQDADSHTEEEEAHESHSTNALLDAN